MTVCELREKLEGVPDYYVVDVIAEFCTLQEVGDAMNAVEAEVYTPDMTLTIRV